MPAPGAARLATDTALSERLAGKAKRDERAELTRSQ